MRAFLAIFVLETRSLARSFAMPALCVFSAAWTLAFPFFARYSAGDGFRTDVLYSLGIVFSVVVLSLSAAAAGTLAKDRDGGVLQLSAVRPAPRFAIALGRIAALVACASLAFAVSCVVLGFRHGGGARCFHVYRPALEDPAQKARELYDEYMASSEEFRENAGKAGKREVLRYLARYAMESYQTVPPGEKASWEFPGAPAGAACDAVRVRFSESFGRVENSGGRFFFRGREGALGGASSGDIVVPLSGESEGGGSELVFENTGAKGVTMNPRANLAVLADAGGLWLNLFRCWLVMSAVAAVAISCGVFLGSTLGRSVAVFSIVALLCAAVASPNIMEEAPDPMTSGAVDRFSLKLTALAEIATSPLNAFSPVSTLAAGECVEWRDVALSALAGFVAYPLLFSFLAGLAIPRKRPDSRL